MDTATILVTVLSACVIALLAWFEVNSRRNKANIESKSTLATSSFESVKTTSKSADESHSQRGKAA